jgi:histidine ammonia-lyase
LLNLERILAIELFNAAQALDFRRPASTSPYLEKFYAQYRERVRFVEDDRILYPDMEESVEFLRDVELDLPEE